MHLENKTKLYVVSFFSNLTFNTAIWMLYLQSYGINLLQVTILQSILNLGMFIFEIPTGIFADRFGKKQSLLVGYTLKLIYIIMLLLYPGVFIVQIIGFFLVGVGYALLSGTTEALLFENIENNKENATKIFGVFNGVGNWARIIGFAAGGLLYHISGKLVYISLFITVVLSAIFCFFLEEKQPNPSENKDSFKMQCQGFFLAVKMQKNNLILFISFSLVVTIVSLLFLFGQEIFDEKHIPVYLIGIIFAVSDFFEGFAGFFAHKFESKIGIHRIFKCMVLLLLFLFAGLLLPHGYQVAIIFVCINFIFGILDPIMTRILNEKFPFEHRTALNSTYSFLSSIFMFALGPVLGFLVLHSGRALYFFISISGMCIFAIILFLLLYGGLKGDVKIQEQ